MYLRVLALTFRVVEVREHPRDVNISETGCILWQWFISFPFAISGTQQKPKKWKSTSKFMCYSRWEPGHWICPSEDVSRTSRAWTWIKALQRFICHFLNIETGLQMTWRSYRRGPLGTSGRSLVNLVIQCVLMTLKKKSAIRSWSFWLSIWIFISRVVLVQPPYRREAPIGSTPLDKKHLGVFLQIFNILRKKGEINLKIDGIG
jgi:hypothetical protein